MAEIPLCAARATLQEHPPTLPEKQEIFREAKFPARLIMYTLGQERWEAGKEIGSGDDWGWMGVDWG